MNWETGIDIDMLLYIKEITSENLWTPDVKSQLFGKDPDAGKDWRQEEKGQQRMRWLDGITNLMDMSLRKLRKIVKDREAWRAAVPGISTSQITEQQQRNLRYSSENTIQ